MRLTYELVQEVATSRAPATVTVKDKTGKIILEIVAKVVYDQGADGGMYPVVRLTPTAAPPSVIWRKWD